MFFSLDEPRLHLLVQIQQPKQQKNEWNLSKVNNEDTRVTSLTSFWCPYCSYWTDSTNYFGVSFVDFEQENVFWKLLGQGWDLFIISPPFTDKLFT